MPSSYPSSKIIHPSSDLDDEVLIKVDNVSKKFCRDFKKSLWYGLKDTAGDIFSPSGQNPTDHDDATLRPSEFWANQSISFEVKRGECLGLIGHNGAGKTTLLKMLNGLMKPDTGSIEMRGKIGALIALGAGFNPILTGRENIYVNGSILGLHKKEIEAKLDEIIDFAEIEDAIDAPVRTYSSGMQVRLGFAVASSFKPDVLLLDEVLAVGDRAFRQKCLDRIGEIIDSTAVIFVSHQAELLAHICTGGVVMQAGKVYYSGTITEALIEYDRVQSEKSVGGSMHRSSKPINQFSVSTNSSELDWGESISLKIDLDTSESGCFGVIQIYIRDVSDTIVAEWHSKSHLDCQLSFGHGSSSLSIELEDIKLAQGIYKLTVNGYDHTGVTYLMSSVNELQFILNKGIRSTSQYQL